MDTSHPRSNGDSLYKLFAEIRSLNVKDGNDEKKLPQHYDRLVDAFQRRSPHDEKQRTELKALCEQSARLFARMEEAHLTWMTDCFGNQLGREAAFLLGEMPPSGPATRGLAESIRLLLYMLCNTTMNVVIRRIIFKHSGGRRPDSVEDFNPIYDSVVKVMSGEGLSSFFTR
ncbi:hypothetical protein ACFL6M_06315, partial [Candidatus Eisenbacteria bacterium]